MAPLPPILQPDPTLEAADAALAAAERARPRRGYLGMSAIGHPCGRKLWYGLRSPVAEAFDAATLKRFADGHASEEIQAARLRLVQGVTLWTVDPATGRQFGYEDHGGLFRGHLDGVICGLLQAPRVPHVWEHKAVGEKKQAQLVKLKGELGEKNALKAWDEVYYAQAVLYCHYAELDRHYLTCASPGTRTVVSVRTDADPDHAKALIAKAKRIIEALAPLARLSNTPDWWQCRFCEYRTVCHDLPAAAPAVPETAAELKTLPETERPQRVSSTWRPVTA